PGIGDLRILHEIPPAAGIGILGVALSGLIVSTVAVAIDARARSASAAQRRDGAERRPGARVRRIERVAAIAAVAGIVVAAGAVLLPAIHGPLVLHEVGLYAGLGILACSLLALMVASMAEDRPFRGAVAFCLIVACGIVCQRQLLWFAFLVAFPAICCW